jgi:hypothetical protein
MSSSSREQQSAGFVALCHEQEREAVAAAAEALKPAFAARRTLTYARTPPDKLDRAVAREIDVLNQRELCCAEIVERVLTVTAWDKLGVTKWPGGGPTATG